MKCPGDQRYLFGTGRYDTGLGRIIHAIWTGSRRPAGVPQIITYGPLKEALKIGLRHLKVSVRYIS